MEHPAITHAGHEHLFILCAPPLVLSACLLVPYNQLSIQQTPVLASDSCTYLHVLRAFPHDMEGPLYLIITPPIGIILPQRTLATSKGLNDYCVEEMPLAFNRRAGKLLPPYVSTTASVDHGLNPRQQWVEKKDLEFRKKMVIEKISF